MQEQKKTTLDYMMHYGAILGVFWIVKYLFFIGESYWVHFIYFYHLLNIVSPLLMYIFYLRYKTETPESHHNVWGCILFVMGMAFFASLFESVVIYAYYAFINPDAFANFVGNIAGVIDELPTMGNISAEQMEEVKEIYISIFSSKLTYIIMNIFGQLSMAFIFSLLIGLLTRNRTQN